MMDSTNEKAPETAAADPATEARRRGAVVLEVLAGARTPGDAAEIIGVSLPQYYLIEARALKSLVHACEPRRKGRGRQGHRGERALRRENEDLRRELVRLQSLARAIQRATGVHPPEGEKPFRRRRRRRPKARALKAARQLRAELAPPEAEAQARRIDESQKQKGDRDE